LTTPTHWPGVRHEARQTGRKPATGYYYLGLRFRSGLQPTRDGAPDALQQLREPGCPVCKSVGTLVLCFFVCYLHEIYRTLMGRPPFTAGFGFCRWHARHKMANGGAYPQIAFVHQFETRLGLMQHEARRRLRRVLRKPTASTTDFCVDCPACSMARENMQ
jgi:hypothetical protein